MFFVGKNSSQSCLNERLFESGLRNFTKYRYELTNYSPLNGFFHPIP